MICVSGGSKSRLAKAAGAEMENCTPMWREAHVEVKMYTAPCTNYIYNYNYNYTKYIALH